MKEKILIFTIGVLVGAVITALGFFVYEKTNNNTNQMPRGEKMQMMERQDYETPKDLQNDKEKDNNRKEHQSKNNSSLENKTN